LNNLLDYAIGSGEGPLKVAEYFYWGRFLPFGIGLLSSSDEPPSKGF